MVEVVVAAPAIKARKCRARDDFIRGAAAVELRRTAQLKKQRKYAVEMGDICYAYDEIEKGKNARAIGEFEKNR